MKRTVDMSELIRFAYFVFKPKYTHCAFFAD